MIKLCNSVKLEITTWGGNRFVAKVLGWVNRSLLAESLSQKSLGSFFRGGADAFNISSMCRDSNGSLRATKA